MKIISGRKFHKIVKIYVDFQQTLMSFRQIQEKICPKVSVKRGCCEKSVEKSLVASRLVCWVTFLVVITKMIVFWSCTVSIRASEAVYSSKHQILKFLACRNGRWRNSEIFKILEKVITGAMQCPWAALPGARILTDAHPTNEIWLVETFECEATSFKAILYCGSGKVVVKK